jgi:hypothetical protein
MLFSRIFWKYVLPSVAIICAGITYIAHRDNVKACESEMAQFLESSTSEVQKKLDIITKERVAAIEEIRKRRQVEAQKRAEEDARQKAELDATIAAAKAERKREQEVVNINVFAKSCHPKLFERQKLIDIEIENIESRLNACKRGSKYTDSELESDEAYVVLLLKRNRLILERRTIELSITRAYQAQQQKMGM